MWTKVKRHSNLPKRAKRETFAVRRGVTNSRVAVLVCPAAEVQAQRASIYSDGNGKLAFLFTDKGEYSARKTNKGSAAIFVSIPNEFVSRIPFGTTECRVDRDGGMIVVDLSQFEKRAVAAE